MSAPDLENLPDPGPGAIAGYAIGYWQATILQTAMRADLFTLLSGAPGPAAEIAARAGYRTPGGKDFLMALVAMGLLSSEQGVLGNTPVSERYLVRGRPQYIGGWLAFLDRELNPAWAGLETALRTGEPQNPAAVHGNPYDQLYRDQEATDAFLDSMDMMNTPIAHRLAALDWSSFRSVVDVGGARGNFAHFLTDRNPGLTATVFDLPALRPAFDRHMAALGATGSVTFTGGDFFTDPLPEADALIFGHILHNWGEEDRIRLLENAYQAVRPGGAVIVYDPMVNGDHPPLNAALAGLSMLVWSAGGHEYSVDECHGWLAKAGFRPQTIGDADAPDDVVVIGYRDR